MARNATGTAPGGPCVSAKHEVAEEQARGATGPEGLGGSVTTSAYIVPACADEVQALVPWSAAAVEQLCAGYSREIAWREADAYQLGYEEGYEAGKRAVETELDAHWAVVARQVRDLGRGDRVPYSERRRRELERARPREGDYMGQLTREQYFGGERAA